jgi:uncharacterized protein YecE (DUF72 family)
MAMIRIGTSGWNYKHWRYIFYPHGLPESRWLEFYGEHLGTVEINYSFYQLPTTAAFKNWRAQTPEGFCFAVKGSRYITHLKRLADPKEHVELFFSRAGELGAKLGPVLWQLPPRFKCNLDRLDAFLQALPQHTRHAFEFRDPSWHNDAVYALLSRHDAALCLANSEGRDRPAKPITTASWVYQRFHFGLDGGNYTEGQLQHLASVIAGFREHDLDVYAYFNNDGGGYAIRNAQRLRALLET